ncbi:MAG: hypothetical protein EBT13_17550 [Rhodobacteraceae bacterium]|jgi:hypothetical protein|nr:hypothetical protein [Paracoccaceae bacterium]
MMTIDKTALKARMLELETEELAAARDHYASFLHEAILAEGEPHERDEMAAARMAVDLAHAFADPVLDHSTKISQLQALDFGPKTVVEPGAIVALGPRLFVISVSTQAFELGDTVLMGISTESPIYQKMKGLEEGDEFENNGVTLMIDFVM